MIEIAATTDPVRLSFLKAALEDAGIAHRVFDQAAAATWPGAFTARLMVAETDAWMARSVLTAAERDL